MPRQLQAKRMPHNRRSNEIMAFAHSSVLPIVKGSNVWSKTLSICLQASAALVIGGLVCLILAWISPAPWSGPKEFLRMLDKLTHSNVSELVFGQIKNENANLKGTSAALATNNSVFVPAGGVAKSISSDKLQEDQLRPTAGGPWSNELEARAAMEHMFQVPFPKARPRWLLNPTTGRCLELDLYSEPLACAVEVDGRQHAEWPNAFHATREMFEQQKLRDALKDTLCKLQGVKLIRIPHTVKRKDIKAFLRQKLLENAILVPKS